MSYQLNANDAPSIVYFLALSPEASIYACEVNIFEAASLVTAPPPGDHHTAGPLAAFLLGAPEQTLVHVAPPVTSALKCHFRKMKGTIFNLPGNRGFLGIYNHNTQGRGSLFPPLC